MFTKGIERGNGYLPVDDRHAYESVRVLPRDEPDDVGKNRSANGSDDSKEGDSIRLSRNTEMSVLGERHTQGSN
jgi:hypothetical protein